MMLPGADHRVQTRSFILFAVTLLWAAAVLGSPAAAQNGTSELTTAAKLSASIKEISEKADKGDTNAQYLMGLYVLYAAPSIDTEPPDYARARKWFELASAKNHTSANFELGKMYSHALGAPKDEAKARSFWVEATLNKHPDAMAYLGSSFWTDHGPTAPADYSKAGKWSQKAADLGVPRGINDIAVAYWKDPYRRSDNNSWGGRRDPRRAVQLFMSAAKLGYCPSMLNLGTLYMNGPGMWDTGDVAVPQSSSNAKLWFSKAIECDQGASFVTSEAQKRLEDVKAGRLPTPRDIGSGGSSASLGTWEKILIFGAGVVGVAAVVDAMTSSGAASSNVGQPNEPTRPCEFWELSDFIAVGRRYDGKPCY